MFEDVKIVLRIAGMAREGVWAYKLRGIFVAASVALGIASLSLIVASVDGAQRKALEIVDWFGPNSVFVFGGDIKSRAVGQRLLTISRSDVDRVRQSLAGASLVVPMRVVRDATLKWGENNRAVPVVVGATDNYAESWNWPLAEGRDLSRQDIDLSARVALIGDVPARELFKDQNPIGQTITVNNVSVQIVGRLSYRGITTGMGESVDDRLIMPITTLTQRYHLDSKYYMALRIKFYDLSDLPRRVADLRSLFRHLHNLREGQDDDFTILTSDEILKFLAMLKGSLVAFLGVTAGVCLLVGGFVLANLFYLSVAERTREIGLRKAVGARNQDILLQFLLEAFYLTQIGAVVGVGLGVGLGEILNRLGVLEIQLSPKIIVLALVSAGLLGLVFGLRPARRAARLDPIHALRGG